MGFMWLPRTPRRQNKGEVGDAAARTLKEHTRMQHADLSYSLPLPLRSAAGVHISTLSRRVSEFLALFLSLFRCFFSNPYKNGVYLIVNFAALITLLQSLQKRLLNYSCSQLVFPVTLEENPSQHTLLLQNK